MKKIQKLEDLQSYPFLTKIVASPSILTVSEQSVRNEVYLALYRHLIEDYPELWKPVIYYKDTLIKELVSDVTAYYEGLFGEKMPPVKIVYTQSNGFDEGVYQTTKLGGKKITRYVKISSKKLPLIKNYLRQYQKGNSFMIPFSKVQNPIINIPARQPLWISVMSLPHELMHAYSFSFIYTPPWTYQSTLMEVSTQEYIAEVMSTKFLMEELGLKSILGEPIHSYEYTLYKLDYLMDKKDSLKFIKNIFTKEYILDNEAIVRLGIFMLSKISMAWHLLYQLTIGNGSFFKYKTLQSVTRDNYGLLYSIVNPEKLREAYEKQEEEDDEFSVNIIDFASVNYKFRYVDGRKIDAVTLFFELSDKVNEMLIHYINPYKGMSKDDVELIRKFMKFGNPDPVKHPDWYKNRYRVRGLFEYFAYEPAVKKGVLKYKDFWQDPREVI